MWGCTWVFTAVLNTPQVLLCPLSFALEKDTNSRVIQTVKLFWRGPFVVVSLPLLSFLFLFSPLKAIETLCPEAERKTTSLVFNKVRRSVCLSCHYFNHTLSADLRSALGLLTVLCSICTVYMHVLMKHYSRLTLACVHCKCADGQKPPRVILMNIN